MKPMRETRTFSGFLFYCCFEESRRCLWRFIIKSIRLREALTCNKFFMASQILKVNVILNKYIHLTTVKFYLLSCFFFLLDISPASHLSKCTPIWGTLRKSCLLFIFPETDVYFASTQQKAVLGTWLWQALLLPLIN